MQRVLDLIMSVLLLVVLLPVFAIVSFLVKVTSKGPVLFAQRRIGKDNKEFMLLKFRTMRVNAPNVATHLLRNPEQYITPIGCFLRKSSLDELPQLLNILKGEMTFIGPRPALYNQYDLTEMRTQAGVHKLVPGVTGWAQVNGRDELGLNEKVECDKYYLENKTFSLDLKIFFMTFFKVLKADGVVEGNTQSTNVHNENASL